MLFHIHFNSILPATDILNSSKVIAKTRRWSSNPTTDFLVMKIPRFCLHVHTSRGKLYYSEVFFQRSEDLMGHFSFVVLYLLNSVTWKNCVMQVWFKWKYPVIQWKYPVPDFQNMLWSKYRHLNFINYNLIVHTILSCQLNFRFLATTEMFLLC